MKNYKVNYKKRILTINSLTPDRKNSYTTIKENIRQDKKGQIYKLNLYLLNMLFHFIFLH